MFTGLVQEIGEIVDLKNVSGAVEFTIRTNSDFFIENSIGDSICCDGVCLTITDFSPNSISVFAQIETMEKTNLANKKIGSRINLEQALRANDRLGGHFVQGHVDGVTLISDVKDREDGSKLVTFNVSEEFSRYLIDRGSVTLNGVSLTIASRNDSQGSVALIPETLKKTTFSEIKVGDVVNVEIDSIARYVEQMVKAYKG